MESKSIDEIRQRALEYKQRKYHPDYYEPELTLLAEIDRLRAEIQRLTEENARHAKVLVVVRHVTECDLSNREMRQQLNAAMNENGFDHEPEPLA